MISPIMAKFSSITVAWQIPCAVNLFRRARNIPTSSATPIVNCTRRFRSALSVAPVPRKPLIASSPQLGDPPRCSGRCGTRPESPKIHNAPALKIHFGLVRDWRGEKMNREGGRPPLSQILQKLPDHEQPTGTPAPPSTELISHSHPSPPSTPPKRPTNYAAPL